LVEQRVAEGLIERRDPEQHPVIDWAEDLVDQQFCVSIGAKFTALLRLFDLHDGVGAPRVANTTNIRFEQVEGEALVIALDLKGVAVSGGSACHSGSTAPSHVLMAMGLDKNAARASLRFSLLRTATEEDVEHVLRVVPQAVEHLRALAPEVAGTLG